MTDIQALPADALYHHCRLSDLSFETTADLPDLTQIIGQTRALDALRFGIGIQQQGYNLYVLGPHGVGKQTAVHEYLEEKTQEGPAPSDWCYINNFEQPNKPRVLQLPAGDGIRLNKAIKKLLSDVIAAVTSAFNRVEYRGRIDEAEQVLHHQQEKAFNTLKEKAALFHITLVTTQDGFAFAATTDDDEIIKPNDFDKLPAAERAQIEAEIDKLQEALQPILRQSPQWRNDTKEKIVQIDRETGSLAIGFLFDHIKGHYRELPAVLTYLDQVQQDIVDNLDDFREQDMTDELPEQSANHSALHRRYEINVIIDHGSSKTAPVIYENNPMHDNLVGRVEHVTHMGTLITDFSLIKPGALHHANGGYLILDARKVLLQPYAWEALKRTLSSSEIRIESLGQTLNLISTVSLEPEAIPLDVKIILLGDRQLYYMLYEYDPDFAELFKVAADFSDVMVRDENNTQLYAQMMATVARKHSLRPFQRNAVARLIEHSARLCEDASKLSSRIGTLTELLQESDYWAAEHGRDIVLQDDVDKAINKKIYRSDRIREQIHEAIKRGTLLIDTDGLRAGQINALSVIELGDFTCGQPSRITATVRVGEGDVIDIEREVELGGEVHSKGVMILSGFLASHYAVDAPLSLAASLVFEQSYNGVDGDSASMAELCCLLSALAAVPIKQSLAITGSVNQFGESQPIGAANEKIEGFFDICHMRGLNGTQGVLIPTSNIEDLMLHKDVVNAAKQGQFNIYPFSHVNQAMELLTGEASGVRDKEGNFPNGTINYKVEQRLHEFALLRHNFGEPTATPPQKNDADAKAS
ncbi:MAG: AAA family ATPase [Thiotrichaceae bacterium]|nr:AAA family ATPase [Thiotrichaceae bacterium]